MVRCRVTNNLQIYDFYFNFAKKNKIMKGFLESVAEGYACAFKGCLDKVTFVMPNKRSGSFLLRELSTYCGSPVVAPRIVTITDFVADITEGVVNHRMPSLFLLYDCYKALSDVGDMDFDKFNAWGETVLNDFNEIDMAMVDPAAIFKNVNDYNSIRTDFLDDDQKKVIEKYFGYSYQEGAREGRDTFWKTFEGIEEVGEDGNIRKRYYALWQVLYPLYTLFKKRLAEEGLTTSGGAFREAVEKLEGGHEPYPGEKIVMVGFNALTEAERRIFTALRNMEVEIKGKKIPKADFIWDPVSELLAGEDDPAVRFVGCNMEEGRFPSPEWMRPYLDMSRPDSAPNVEVIAVPSNVMQAKVISACLSSSLGERQEEVSNARVAVVLPDENLLLPLLYSLPEDLSNPNLTMGYPLRHTPVVSFVGLLRRMQARVRNVNGHPEFFFEDVADLLGHPYAKIIFGSERIGRYIAKMNEEKRITVAPDTTVKLGEASSVVFRSVKDENPDVVIRYISDILELVRARLSDNCETFLRTKVENSFIDSFMRALVLLSECIHRYDTNVSALGVFRLAERQIARETVPFEGEPLRGLQVMGLLETRALDFKYVFMPSMNDKVMPRRSRTVTFIPNALRIDFGMPPANYQEELFAYYFYRLAGRCSKLTLTYDSRSGDNRGGGVSRYVLQLRYLADKIDIREVEAQFSMPEVKKERRTIEKSGPIMDKLMMYRPGARSPKGEKPKNFSASALSKYGNCPLNFLFNNVAGLYLEPDPIETINHLDLGSIVHKVMERLYLRQGGKPKGLNDPPISITEDFLQGLLDEVTPAGESLIKAETRWAINKIHFRLKEERDDMNRELRGSSVIVSEYIENMVRSIIRHDMRLAPFLLFGSEIKLEYEYPLPDGSKVNFKMEIDRLDQVGNELRIVDYKTGKVHLDASRMHEVFDGTGKASNILQLGIYGMILEAMAKDNEIAIKGWKPEDIAEKLKLVIYNIPAMRMFDMTGKEESNNKRENSPKVGVGHPTLSALMDYVDEEGAGFKESLDTVLMEIMDPETPFSAVPNAERCRYCEYKIRCENIKNA